MYDRPRILVIGTLDEMAERVESALSLYNYEVVHASTIQQGLVVARQINTDTIVLITSTSDAAFRNCKLISSEQELEDVPVMVLVEEECDEATMVEAQYYGVLSLHEFAIREFELISNVYSLVRIKQLQDEQKSRLREMEYMASTDALTGLYNRRFFFVRLEEEISRSARSDFSLCLVYIDIDHFKAINDTYGHATGDVVLKAVASTLSGVLRKSDILGRIGGEEFLILLPQTESAAGMQIAERLRQLVAAQDIPLDDLTLRVTISAGVYCSTENRGVKLDELVHYADEALYAAKHGGRNLVVEHSTIATAD